MTNVVRSGDTFRRPIGPWSTTIHRLLTHLRVRGIDWSPEPRGVDDEAREIRSFLPGVVPAYPLPAWVWPEDLLTAPTQHLRTLHDATLEFPIDGATLQSPVHEPAEVICHNDFVPYDLACSDERIVGVIDFDTASPGSRLRAFAYRQRFAEAGAG